MSNTLEGSLDGSGLRIAVVVSRFNDDVTSKMLDGAREALAKHNVRDEDTTIAWVPGAFELPLTARKLAETKRFDAVVCLGTVIRGETPHFDFVAGEAARGIMDVGRDTGVPVAFGVTTPNDKEQALARAGGKKGNKGFDAVETAIEMATLLRRIAAE
jgi:6,7-dimethyl-8-ribityllumazine synthase